MQKYLPWVAGAVGLYFLARTRFAANLKGFVRSIRFTGGLAQPTLQLGFTVQNISNLGATVQAVNGEVYANGSLIANFANFEMQRIRPRSESSFTVQARPAALGLIQTIVQAIQNKDKRVTITVRGNINTGLAVIPFESSYALI